MFRRIIPIVAFFIPGLATAQTFSVSTLEISNYTSVVAVADYRQQFFCLQEDGTLFRFDSTGKTQKQPITVFTLKNIYSRRDTLFGVAGLDSLYYFYGNDFHYTGRRVIGNLLYQDIRYEVMSSCSGEWGGSVYFIDRKTGRKYACRATCPVMGNKTDTSYIITASLAHLSGSTEILEIRFPDRMQIYNFKPPKRRIMYVGDNESHSSQGVKVLVDSIGLFTIGSFPIDGEILHVVTDFKQTYICRIRNGSFETIQKLADKSFWSYRTASWLNSDGVGFSFFLNHQNNGILRVAGRHIQIYLFRYKSNTD